MLIVRMQIQLQPEGGCFPYYDYEGRTWMVLCCFYHGYRIRRAQPLEPRLRAVEFLT